MYKLAVRKLTSFIFDCATYLCQEYKSGRIDDTHDVLLRQVTPFSVYAKREVLAKMSTNYDSSIAYYLVYALWNNTGTISALISHSMYVPGKDSLSPKYSLVDFGFLAFRQLILVSFIEMLLLDKFADRETKGRFITAAMINDPVTTRSIMKSSRFRNHIQRHLPHMAGYIS